MAGAPCLPGGQTWGASGVRVLGKFLGLPAHGGRGTCRGPAPLGQVGHPSRHWSPERPGLVTHCPVTQHGWRCRDAWVIGGFSQAPELNSAGYAAGHEREDTILRPRTIMTPPQPCPGRLKAWFIRQGHSGVTLASFRPGPQIFRWHGPHLPPLQATAPGT